MNIDYTVGEVELSCKPKFKNEYKASSSEDAKEAARLMKIAEIDHLITDTGYYSFADEGLL